MTFSTLIRWARPTLAIMRWAVSSGMSVFQAAKLSDG